MCGIAGLSLPAPHQHAAAVTQRMAAALAHRGPDSAGIDSSTRGHTWLGFRRLAIRDLHARANQPMVSASGRSLIVFNGEIYNSADLARRYLAGRELRTCGDTEVVLEVIEQEGLGVLAELNGMFAMAIVNREQGDLCLVRDRMGKKPLYMYQHQRFLAFASELRALKPFGLEVDPSHAELFFHFGYFPSPFTFYRHTTQVRPGEVVQVAKGQVIHRHTFHAFSDVPWGNHDVDLDTCDALLADATRKRLLSDVAVGSFLSGGVDSALVAAQLPSDSVSPTPTFTVAFDEQRHNEAEDAAETAKSLGLPHTVIPIEPQHLPDLALAFQDCYEQPYADTSGLVTMLLCRAVKQHVTVALSGDGGDEFFGGYARYSWFRQAMGAQRSPALLRQLVGRVLQRADRRRGHRLARWLAAADPAALYAEIVRNWHVGDIHEVLEPTSSSPQPEDLVRQIFDRTTGDALAKAACFDATYYIPDDLQVKLDRASMQVALEVRCPLLDYRVAQLGMGLPTARKFADGLKSFLKQVLRRHVPPAVLQRPKRGFSVPLASWLAGPLRDVCEQSFQSRQFQELGWLQPAKAAQVWHNFLRGQTHTAHQVWMLFSLSQHSARIPADPLFASLQDEQGYMAANAA